MHGLDSLNGLRGKSNEIKKRFMDINANDIHIKYYSTTNDEYLDKKIIGHKRDM